MRNFSAVFLALVFGLTSARGEWSIVSTTSEFSSGRAVEHRHLVTEDSATGGRATVDAAMFFAKDARLRVIDNASGNDSLGQIMEREKCIAGVNGGYFDPEFKPLGLRVRDGLTTSTLLRAPLLTGIIFSTRERVDIVSPSSFRSSQKIDAALQCGPFLVEGGAALRTLNNTRSARRTFAAVARDGRVAVGVSSDVTLAELGAMLSAALPAARALNLDGGSSSAFYFHRADGSAVSIAEEKSVRDFIGVSTR